MMLDDSVVKMIVSGARVDMREAFCKILDKVGNERSDAILATDWDVAVKSARVNEVSEVINGILREMRRIPR